jgi:hypothetical protein
MEPPTIIISHVSILIENSLGSASLEVDYHSHLHELLHSNFLFSGNWEKGPCVNDAKFRRTIACLNIGISQISQTKLQNWVAGHLSLYRLKSLWRTSTPEMRIER